MVERKTALVTNVMKVSDKARSIGAVLGTALSTLKEGKGLVLVAIQRR